MDKGAVFRRVSSAVNTLMLPVVRSAPGRRLFGGSMAVVTYTGRKSGREVTFPVNYRRAKSGDEIVIGVMAVPSSTDSWAAWHGLGGSDLAWIANDPASSVFARRAAGAELQRRAIRNADPVTAGTLIRRTGPLSRR